MVHDFFPQKFNSDQKVDFTGVRQKLHWRTKIFIDLLVYKKNRADHLACFVQPWCIWKGWVWHNFTIITTPKFLCNIKVSCMYVFFWSKSLQIDLITLFLGYANYSQKNCKTKTVHKKTMYNVWIGSLVAKVFQDLLIFTAKSLIHSLMNCKE